MSSWSHILSLTSLLCSCVIFTYVLFNVAVSSRSDHIVSVYKKCNEQWIGKNVEQAVVAWFENLVHHLLGGTEENYKNS